MKILSVVEIFYPIGGPVKNLAITPIAGGGEREQYVVTPYAFELDDPERVLRHLVTKWKTFEELMQSYELRQQWRDKMADQE